MTFFSIHSYETMNGPWPPGLIVCGTGGDDARVEAFSFDSGKTEVLLNSLPSSVYSIDIDCDSGRIAAGTKGGEIYLLKNTCEADPDNPVTVKKLLQGAPVLSVSWLGESLLAVSDTLGRCLLWDTNHESIPKPLEGVKGVICSTLNLKQNMLTGFSSAGKLLFWEPPKWQLVDSVEVPGPPAMSALVHMLYWSKENALVFPSDGGRLTFYDLTTKRVTDLQAHKGDFYAISLIGEDLLTAGVVDQRLKIWSSISVKPRSLSAPADVIAAGVARIEPAVILLIDTMGSAGTYILEGDHLTSVSMLEGRDYRVVWSLPEKRARVFRDQSRKEEVGRIVNEIQENAGQTSDDTIEGYHCRLIDLGYRHISLALRVEEADQREDIVETLSLSSSLVDILPQNEPGTCASMEKYALFLAKAWHMNEANTVCENILKIVPGYPLDRRISELGQIAKIVAGKRHIIESDIPVKTIIHSANAIGKLFAGRYVIKRLKPRQCSQIRLSPKMIKEKYEEVCTESKKKGLPPAKTEHAWWLSRSGEKKMEIVRIGEGQSSTIKGLQFVIQVFQNGHNTAVVPVVVLDWHTGGPEASFKQENENAFAALACIEDQMSAYPYLQSIYEALEIALRRLVTAKLQKTGNAW